MRYGLQYLYSILVFFGVLACSYFMVSQDTTAPGIPFRSIEAPPLRAEASALDPGVSKLFEMEQDVIKSVPIAPKATGGKRNLTKSAEKEE